jgi:hypothetical protein
MFATLLATGGVYLYGQVVENRKNEELTKLNNEINSFNYEDMIEVVDFDSRLNQVNDRINHSASLVSIFNALEEATVGTVKISSLLLDRVSDEGFILRAKILTDSFDSTIFQRDIYSDSDTVRSVTVSEVQSGNESFLAREGVLEEDEIDIDDSTPNVVKFTALLDIPLSAVPFTAENVQAEEPIVITDPNLEAELNSVMDEEVIMDNNEQNI